MQFLILDRLGNAVAAYDDEGTARANLHAIVEVEPEAADEIVLVQYDDDGMPVGEPVTAYDAPLPVTVRAPEYVLERSTTATVRRVTKAQRRYFPGVVPLVPPARVLN
jgi:hypothetical protein